MLTVVAGSSGSSVAPPTFVEYLGLDRRRPYTQCTSSAIILSFPGRGRAYLREAVQRRSACRMQADAWCLYFGIAYLPEVLLEVLWGGVRYSAISWWD